MCVRVLVLALLAGSAAVNAQQLSTVEELLPRIVAYAHQYRQRVPSFEVDESAVSQELRDGRVKREVQLEMTLRHVRDTANPDEMKDSYTFRTVDGKPPRKHFKLPYFVNGAFANAMGFAGNDGGSCYEFRVSAGPYPSTAQLELWQKKQDPMPKECADVFENYRKTVVVDVASGRILKVTRSMSETAARNYREAVYIEVDYAPQKLGEETFWLPVRFLSHDAKNKRRMIATYSNFHRYTSTVKITAGSPLDKQSPSSIPLE